MIPQTLHIHKRGLHQEMGISNKQNFSQFGWAPWGFKIPPRIYKRQKWSFIYLVYTSTLVLNDDACSLQMGDEHALNLGNTFEEKKDNLFYFFMLAPSQGTWWNSWFIKSTNHSFASYWGNTLHLVNLEIFERFYPFMAKVTFFRWKSVILS